MKKEPLDRNLFRILACPMCKSNLNYNKDKTKLICIKCKKDYNIPNLITILLIIGVVILGYLLIRRKKRGSINV